MSSSNSVLFLQAILQSASYVTYSQTSCPLVVISSWSRDTCVPLQHNLRPLFIHTFSLHIQAISILSYIGGTGRAGMEERQSRVVLLEGVNGMMSVVTSESGEAMVCTYQLNNIPILLTEKLRFMGIMRPDHKHSVGS